MVRKVKVYVSKCFTSSHNITCHYGINLQKTCHYGINLQKTCHYGINLQKTCHYGINLQNYKI